MGRSGITKRRHGWEGGFKKGGRRRRKVGESEVLNVWEAKREKMEKVKVQAMKRRQRVGNGKEVVERVEGREMWVDRRRRRHSGWSG